jgi:cytochrome c oxidase subunit 3
MTEPVAILNEPWDDLARQREAMRFGIWLFLAGEILFFGGLLLVYAVLRVTDPAGLVAGAREAAFAYGFANTLLLLTSSCAMTVAERAAKEDFATVARIAMGVALALGLCFLVVKGFEYWEDLEKGLFPGPGFAFPAPGASRFWAFYWTATLVHMAHLVVGLALIARLIAQDYFERAVSRRWMAVEVTTYYWHFVDAIWIILFPLIYLAGRGQ